MTRSAPTLRMNSGPDYQSLLSAAVGLTPGGGPREWWSSGGSGVETAFSQGDHAACFEVEQASFWFRHRSACIVALAQTFNPGGIILDVGGGNGVVTEALRHAGFGAVVLEPGLEGARNALTRGLAPVVHSTWEAACFPPRSVPAIGLFDVLEHIEDDVGFLSRLEHGLRAGGRIFLTTPAHPRLWSREDERAGHFRRYTRASLRGALERAGFHVDYVTEFFTPLVPAVFISRTLGVRRALGSSAADEHVVHSPRLRRALEAVLGVELVAVRARRTLPIGASLLATAHLPPFT